MNLAIAASIFFVVIWLFVLVSFSLPSVDSIESEYVLGATYDDVAAQHVGFNLIAFLLSSAPGFVLWLLMVLNQKRVVEHLLNHKAPLNTASGLIDR